MQFLHVSTEKTLLKNPMQFTGISFNAWSMAGAGASRRKMWHK
jgi:hypothetical protein